MNKNTIFCDESNEIHFQLLFSPFKDKISDNSLFVKRHKTNSLCVCVFWFLVFGFFLPLKAIAILSLIKISNLPGSFHGKLSV